MKYWKPFVVLFALYVSPAYAACPAQHNYNVVKLSPSGACVGMRLPRNPAVKNLDGDLEWIAADGTITSIGAAPYNDDFVVTDDGVLMVLYGSQDMQVVYWDSKLKATKACNTKDADKVRTRDVRRGKITFIFGDGFIQIKRESNAQSYFENCENTGSQLIYSDLSGSDRAILEKYGSDGMSNDLTSPNVASTISEIKGREEIVDQIIASLRTANVRSTLLWGPAGTGKTSIAYRLAQRIHNKEVPVWLRDWSVYLIKVGKLNDKFVGGADSNMKELISAASGRKVILIMDEIHELINIGVGGEDQTDVTEHLKTDLANGQLAIIGTLTDAAGEMARFRSKEALFRRFNPIFVTDPPDAVLMEIYTGQARKLREQFAVEFSDEMLGQMITLTRRYLPAQHHPGVGVKLMEQIASAIQLQRAEDEGWKNREVIAVTKPLLRRQIGIFGNVRSLMDGDGRTFRERVATFVEDMRAKYVGHENAIQAINYTMRKVATGNRPRNRPSGVFLFLGPSGVGKTYLAELFAKEMFGEDKYKEYAMNQFKEEASINNFLGSWKGYVGYDASGGGLTKWIKDNPESLINFDEVEKASNSVKEAMLRLLDKGKIEDNSNTESDFTNGFIVMTSNFAMDLIDAYDSKVRGIENPALEGEPVVPYGIQLPTTDEGLERAIRELMVQRQVFGEYTTAFLGRIDQVIVFHHFNEEEQAKVARMEVKKALKDINPEYREVVKIDPELMNFLIAEGFDFHTGARKARAQVQRFVIDPIADAMMNFPEDIKVKSIEVKLRGLQRGVPEGIAIVELAPEEKNR